MTDSDTGRPVGTVTREIHDVWIGYDDFETGGYPYVGWLIEQDVADMRADEWDENECVEELADVCINAMRMMLERGYSPEAVLINRLVDHREKGPEKIIEKYQRRYANTGTEQFEGNNES